MAKRSIKQIAGMSQYDLSQLTKTELQSMYRALRGAVKRRVKTFEKHGSESAVPKPIKELKAASKMKKKDLIKSIGAAGNFYLSERGTYTGYKRVRKKIRQSVEQKLKMPVTEKTLSDLGEFLDEMRERAGEMLPGIYEKAMELFKAAEAKGVDPAQFAKNYDYWTENKHLEALKQAEPIRKKGKVLPSDYIEQLGLPSIEKYEDTKYDKD